MIAVTRFGNVVDMKGRPLSEPEIAAKAAVQIDNAKATLARIEPPPAVALNWQAIFAECDLIGAVMRLCRFWRKVDEPDPSPIDPAGMLPGTQPPHKPPRRRPF